MLKIKDDVDLKELEKFGYKKNGGTTDEFYYFLYYTKHIYRLFNSYEIYINGTSKEIVCFKNLTLDNSFANVDRIKMKYRWIRDLIQAGLVEKVEE